MRVKSSNVDPLTSLGRWTEEAVKVGTGSIQHFNTLTAHLAVSGSSWAFSLNELVWALSVPRNFLAVGSRVKQEHMIPGLELLRMSRVDVYPVLFGHFSIVPHMGDIF